MANFKEDIQAVAAEIVDAADFVDNEEQQKILEELQAIRKKTEPQILKTLQVEVLPKTNIELPNLLSMRIHDFLERFHHLHNPDLNKHNIPLRRELRKNGISYIIDLVSISENQAFKLERIGPKRVRILRRFLQTFGLDFGMDLDPDLTVQVRQRIQDQHCKNEAGTL
ncbi:MAG TPA: hypothetical protein PKA32_01420 [Candidatus Gracilibacteria bacterium]|nr:hypothetical protein [Candidatus Gracilibacteria bacterium]